MDGLSVAIITFNEEKNIARCISSIKEVADEIIVVDSFSTDGTAAVAKSLGATVHQEKFRGYIEQKNFAVKLIQNNYVLSLDADEALDGELIKSILSWKGKMDGNAFTMNRCANYCGKYIRHGLWYPDKKLRIFDKRIALWGGINPHDKVTMLKPANIIHLKGDILHYSYSSIEDHIMQNNKFSSISAEALFTSGKRTNILKVIFHPVWSFINGYFFRLGFIDGFYGLVIAVNAAHFTFQKHTKLMQIQRSRSDNR